jgi:phosphatidylglycerophosphate synthase
MQIKQQIPNALTILRLIIAVIIGVSIFIPDTLTLVQVVTVIGIISDKLDGTLARTWKVVSERGKKLESVADPLFNLLCGIYIIAHLSFPWVIFWCGIVGLSVTVIGRIIVRLRTGKFFYEKSPITRYATVSIFVLNLLYLFSIPYRAQFATLVCVYGFIVVGNYIRMMVRFVQREKTASRAVSQ